MLLKWLNNNIPFAVHYGKIRIHLCQSSVNKMNIHSLDQIGNHLSESHIHLEILHKFGHSIKFLHIQMANSAIQSKKTNFHLHECSYH